MKTGTQQQAGTLFAGKKAEGNKKHEAMSTQVVKQQSGSQKYLSELNDEIRHKINETLFRNRDVFNAATDENKLFIVQKLAKIFSFSFENYKITPERVYLLSLRGQVVVSLHYLVYLKIAAQSGVKVIKFERTGSGEKVIVRHKDDDFEREYFLDYENYKKRSGVWQAHFDVMFRKTLLKQAIMFLFADIYENEVFSEVVNFEEEDLVEEPNKENKNTNQVDSNFTRKTQYLVERINKNKSVFSSDKKLLLLFEQHMKLRGYNSVIEIKDESDLKYFAALSEALVEQKTNNIDTNEALEKREKLLIALMNHENKSALKDAISDILSRYNYVGIAEIGKLEVLKEIEKLLNKDNYASAQ